MFQANQQQEQCAQQGVIYSPFRGGNTAVEAFKEKIDFAAQKKELKRINSPYLCEQNTGIRPPEAKPITSFIPP